MCMSVPKVPTVPDRQAAKSPDAGAADGLNDDRMRRRMAMAGAMTKGAGGLGSGPRVTNMGGMPSQTLGGSY